MAGRDIKNIVLAEDDRGTALLAKRELERLGYLVFVAGNGREALDLIHSTQVDLLITDVVMPVMDGIDLYLELKQNEATESLPIIIVTDKQMFQESFTTLGVDHFVAKASNIQVLAEKIRHIDRLQKEARHYRKILVCSGLSEVAQQVCALLQQKDCLVSIVNNPIDLVSKALLMRPHLVLIDLLMEGDVSGIELIRSLRCYDVLKDVTIITYVHLSPNDVGSSQNTIEHLEELIRAAEAAGAAQYLGRFNRVTFLDSLKKFGVV